MNIRKCTAGAGNHQLLYFTSSSLTTDSLVYMGDENGSPNLYCTRLSDGATRQLTTRQEGFLQSYVYFDGTPYHGFGKASPSLDHKNGLVYYIQGMEIRCVSLTGEDRLVAMLPANQLTGFTHVSADGRFLCVPTVDAAAFDGFVPRVSEAESIDDRVHALDLSSYLHVYDTQTGEKVICKRVPRCWITHVQFSPADNTKILYNHEWSRDCGIRRMWLFDGARHIPLRAENAAAGRSRDDWTCHEMWQADGQFIIYHGTYKNGISYIGRVRPDGSDAVEIPLPADYKSYGHFTIGTTHNAWLTCDGYYRTESDGDDESNWITRLDVNWEKREIAWKPLCRHGSSWASQDEHPHPIFGQGDKFVYFTSDKSGKREVYAVEA